MNFIKVFSTTFFLIIFCNSARCQSISKNVFLRLYNLEGKKIATGYLRSINENSLSLSKSRDIIDFSYSEIGVIKTKRGLGQKLILGASIGALGLGFFGASTANPDEWFGYTVVQGATGGAILGVLAGTVIGVMIDGLKNSRRFKIDANEELWNSFKEEMKENTLPAKKDSLTN
jgi:hypothetical protein